MTDQLETATLGGGCFWCVEAVLLRLRGVHAVRSGYAGGNLANPSYEAVCTGTTGHAEVVQVEFDPAEITFGDILNVFFATHDPTTLNRQGADSGTQYRSVIFYHNDEQRTVAERTIADLEASGIFDDPIVTEVTPLDHFYPAEAYHQDYYARHPRQPYCTFTIDPKVAKLRQKFAALLKQPVG
jgi:peptide-methionine (S)-S-oxide reductase